MVLVAFEDFFVTTLDVTLVDGPNVNGGRPAFNELGLRLEVPMGWPRADFRHKDVGGMSYRRAWSSCYTGYAAIEVRSICEGVMQGCFKTLDLKSWHGFVAQPTNDHFSCLSLVRLFDQLLLLDLIHIDIIDCKPAGA